MNKPKPIPRFILFSLSLVLILLFSIATVSVSSEPPTSPNGDEMESIEELIALDEEEEFQRQQDPDWIHHETKGKPSEAEVLSKAQRIVFELNNDNTQKAIDENEYVLVLGYAPWCVRSAELMPNFAGAATALKELGSPLLMAKLDAERYPKAASALGIHGFPTLLLFVNGTSQPYTGGFTSEEIVIWVRKKTGVPVIRINSIVEANMFSKQHSIFAVGLFQNYERPEYEEFIKAAISNNEIQFVETTSVEIAMVFFPDVKPVNGFLGLVKSDSEKYTAFEDTFEADRILNFVDDNKFPLVTTMTEINSAKVYSSTNKNQVFFFADVDDFKKLHGSLQDVARKFKSKIMFVYVDINEDNLAKPFLTLFGLEDSEDSAVIAFDYKGNNKYLLEADPTPRNIEDFCSGLSQGTLSPYYKSQPVPDNGNASVLTVVGKTFDDLVLSNPKNVLLEVHTPWCISCETISKQIEKLAKHFEGLEELVFARTDASTNEHPKLQVDDYPTLLFYPSGDKSNPVKLPTKSSAKELAALVNKNLKLQDHTIKDEL